MLNRHLSRAGAASLAALALALAFAIPSHAVDPAIQFVSLRIQGEKDKVQIEMPLQLLQFLSEHSKDEQFCVGSVEGHETRFAMADLMKIVQSGKAKAREVLFFTAKDEHGERGDFFVKTFTKKVHGGAGKASGMTFTVLKDGKEKVGISVSMDTVESWAKDFGSGDREKGADDFGPLVRSALASAKDFGTGVLLHIETKDAELIFSLK